MEDNLLDEALLSKFLSGEATPEEAMLVNDWIAASEENKTYYAQAEKVWSLGKDIQKMNSNKAQVWSELNQLTNAEVRTKQTFFTPYRIAAAIALLIGVSATIYFLNQNKTDSNQIAWETKQTFSEVARLSLPDGSSVTVNRNSTIKWPKEMKGASREIILQGEAFFDVSHDPAKPFVITADEIKIKVLGTAFNVQDNKEKNEIETEVTRGKVLMYTTEKQITIEAGMKGIYRRQTKELILEKLQSENNIAYATHELSFSDATLKEVTDQLSKAYGVQFVFKNKKIEDCLLTTEYRNRSLSFVMNVIAESLNLTYEIKDNTVYISGDGCL